MRPITEIVVHCTATRPDWWAGKTPVERVAEVRRWHLERGWRDIGYHYLIDRNGVIVPGRPLDEVGAHVQGHNTGTIGVALFGGHGSAETDAFAYNFTPEQDASLRKLIADLSKRFSPLYVTGHNKYAAKACPGFQVGLWLKGVPVAVAPPPGPAAVTKHQRRPAPAPSRGILPEKRPPAPPPRPAPQPIFSEVPRPPAPPPRPAPQPIFSEVPRPPAPPPDVAVADRVAAPPSGGFFMRLLRALFGGFR
jgi:N-acetylmuramoyl-L-alanine amidase